jgi:hypothetical protein
MVTRRRVLRTGLTTAVAVSGTAASLRPMLAASTRRAATDNAGPPEEPRRGAEGSAPPLFDEVYRDRRIQGYPSDGEAGLDIRIDGRPLELMRRVDGSWISVANHFQPYLTPLATARGAVDAIGRADLSMNDPGMSDPAMSAPSMNETTMSDPFMNDTTVKDTSVNSGHHH